MIHPYGEIRKVPLDFEGIQSSAFAVQRKHEDNKGRQLWKEAGVVGSNYLLVPNADVRDLAQQIATESNMEWEFTREFFDGRRFGYFMQCKSDKVAVTEGDDVALGMGFWNSYDGSTSLQFRTFLVRLLCTNGMITKDYMNLMKFKHDKTSEDYEEQIIKAAKVVDNCGPDIETVVNKMRKMVETPCDLNTLANIRNHELNDIPVTLWGKISSNFLHSNLEAIHDNEARVWDFYNSCTNVLWHDEKPTMASFEHNQRITDTFLNAAS